MPLRHADVKKMSEKLVSVGHAIGLRRRRQFFAIQERSEDRQLVFVTEVVVHDVDEIVRIEDLAKQFVRRTSRRVQVRPLLSELEGFVFPRFEARLLDDCGL